MILKIVSLNYFLKNKINKIFDKKTIKYTLDILFKLNELFNINFLFLRILTVCNNTCMYNIQICTMVNE